jgi:Uma2 family endonuclease
MTWREVCSDKSLADLPYKIELDKYGKITMSPAGKKHSKLQSRLIKAFLQAMPHGDALPECAVETSAGTKAPDVAWISESRWASMNPDEFSCSLAPEICVEILSPSNTLAEMLGTTEKPGKRELYFQAGASEVWMCDATGRLSFYKPTGQMPRSELCPEFPERV